MIKQNHDECVEHVKVEGYKRKVCILAGQNREDVIQFALDVQKVKNEVSTEYPAGARTDQLRRA